MYFTDNQTKSKFKLNFPLYGEATQIMDISFYFKHYHSYIRIRYFKNIFHRLICIPSQHGISCKFLSAEPTYYNSFLLSIFFFHFVVSNFEFVCVAGWAFFVFKNRFQEIRCKSNIFV